MSEQEPVRIKVGRFTLEGYSIAGEQTAIRVAELNCCFDLGRAPFEAVRSPVILLSHAHQDHMAGVSYYFSNRNFRGMNPGLIVLPKAIEADARALMRVWRKLERHPIPYRLKGVRAGQRFSIGRRIEVLAFETEHLGPSLGYCLMEVRQKLLPKYVGLTPEQIQEIARGGKGVSRNVRAPLITYLGDTEVAGLQLPDVVYDSDVMIVECTFLAPEHRERATAGRHVHAADLAAFLSQVRSRHIVLHHFSSRYAAEQVPGLLARYLPGSLLQRVRLFLPSGRLAGRG